MATAINTDSELQVKWQEAKQRLADALETLETYDRDVYTPAHDRERAFEDEHGLIPPRVDRKGTPGYFEKWAALHAANPGYRVPDPVSEEYDRLTEAMVDAQAAVMATVAPDLAALRWKLDHALDIDFPEDEDGGNTPCWTGQYVRQMIADIRRLLPTEA